MPDFGSVKYLYHCNDEGCTDGSSDNCSRDGGCVVVVVVNFRVPTSMSRSNGSYLRGSSSTSSKN